MKSISHNSPFIVILLILFIIAIWNMIAYVFQWATEYAWKNPWIYFIAFLVLSVISYAIRLYEKKTKNPNQKIINNMNK